jgi:hypothetical protein
MNRAGCCFVFVAGFACVGVLRAERETASLTDKEKEALRQELAAMVKEDQDARMATIQDKDAEPILWKKVEEIDTKNTRRMKEIIAKVGWPGKTLIGEEGAHNAWLLVQHADRNREFQKECLVLLEKAVKQARIWPT